MQDDTVACLGLPEPECCAGGVDLGPTPNQQLIADNGKEDPAVRTKEMMPARP